MAFSQFNTRARYYPSAGLRAGDPTTGRFLTRDTYPALAPVPQSLHRYTYCGNDPVNRTDPSGQWWKDLAKRARRMWRRLRRPIRRTEQRLERWGRRTEQTARRWRQDPQREAARVRAAANRFVTRKEAELTSDVRGVASAVERGDWEGAIAGSAVYMLHFTCATDVRLTRNLAAGMASTVYESTVHFERNWATVTDPRVEVGSRAWNRALGEVVFTGFNVATMGGVGDIRYGAAEGDWLRVASGAMQVIPGTGVLDEVFDAALAGREVARGLKSGNVAQVEAGLFGLGVNVLQALSPRSVVHRVERPVEYLAEGVERAGRSAGDLAGRTVRGATGEAAERAGRGAWEGVRRFLGEESGQARLGRAVPEDVPRVSGILGPEGPRQFVMLEPDDAADAALLAAGRVDVAGRRLLGAGEATSLAGQPGRLLPAPSGAGRVLELGSGGDENLLRIAEARPDKIVVGIESILSKNWGKNNLNAPSPRLGGEFAEQTLSEPPPGTYTQFGAWVATDTGSRV